MDGINHRTITTNGIKIHIAEKGNGPVVLLLHGFPELWYSWRHQIIALARLGYRAVAPDLRGFGDSDAPADPQSYTSLHVVGDIVGLIDAVKSDGEEKVFVVGHDWGALIAWYLSWYRPDKVKAMVNMSVPYSSRNPNIKPGESFRAGYGDDFYICRFQEPGKIEAEFAQLGTKTVLTEFLTLRDPGPLLMPQGKLFGHSPGTPIILPSWLAEEDVDYFTEKFEKKGFTGPLNYYRNMDRTWELTSPWSGAQVTVPVKFIIGDQDLCYNFLGVKDYMHKGGFKKAVPLLEDVVIMEGAGHFINQEKPDEISRHIHDFIKKF